MTDTIAETILRSLLEVKSEITSLRKCVDALHNRMNENGTALSALRIRDEQEKQENA